MEESERCQGRERTRVRADEESKGDQSKAHKRRGKEKQGREEKEEHRITNRTRAGERRRKPLKERRGTSIGKIYRCG